MTSRRFPTCPHPYYLQMDNNARTVLLLLFFLLPCQLYADIYQWRDSNGSVHFSDRPTSGKAEKIEVKPSYAYFGIKKVFDGDTVMLDDGRKIRLLGINTPEIQHRDKPAEAGGEEAKRWLTGKLLEQKVRLEIGSEKTDKYGRTLAHLFTENKEHINLALVKKGLASVNLYPTNPAYADELVKAQDEAEQAKFGIWGRPEYATLPVDSLIEKEPRGWTRLIGTVTDIRFSRKSAFLKLSAPGSASNHPILSLRIEKKWLSLFPDLNAYSGKTVEARGWLNKRKGEWSMLIRHPSAIKIRQ